MSERTNRFYNMDLADRIISEIGYYETPIIRNKAVEIPDHLIPFGYPAGYPDNESGIHFFIDDYRFERIWNDPRKYTELLKRHKVAFTPDWSLYTDMNIAIQIFNVYRSRLIGAYYQREGVNIIPTIGWSTEKSFEFCFQGVERGSVVAISTVGIKRDKEARQLWEAGVSEMIRRISPRGIIIYGGNIGYDFPENIKIYEYEAFQPRLRRYVSCLVSSSSSLEVEDQSPAEAEEAEEPQALDLEEERNL